jgi:hypothetical protein
MGGSKSQNILMVHLDAIKLYSINALAFLSTLTTLDIVLKLTLLVASIIYTTVKIIAVVKNELNIKSIIKKEDLKEEDKNEGLKGEIKNDKG